MKSIIIIPARYGSTRFLGKPLALLKGEPVIVHVVRAALQAKSADAVCVATDDQRIAETVSSNFANDVVNVVMTGECRTGTDRLAQAVQSLNFDLQNLVVVNVQGDEPFINSHHIESLIDVMQSDESLQMATLATPLPQHLTSDPNVVKVVCAQNGNALYFSRLPIPFARDGETVTRLRHLGVYAYRADWLLQMANLPSTPLEETEKLEQLRALENGVAIRVVTVENVIDIAIDTPEDLQRAEEYLAGKL
ncbi:MAG TPA: 3-deoxy-manno-octulosonate cytidylyltransferase [Abditibacteriaceae bacterium]|jgi:3-deoxy-manno-octulosonate cytidylyltransferase (CMP-KDO synthetase)